MAPDMPSFALGVSGGFSQGSSVFAPPTDWPVSYISENNLES